MDWQDKRIHLYVYIYQQYDQKHLWFYTQRMSNNDTPTFTDEEVLTIYLFGIMQQHTQIMAIYTYTKDHLSDIRQPIAALFSWIEQKTNLSMASRVRSEDGLLVHVFGRLTAACFLLAFYS